MPDSEAFAEACNRDAASKEEACNTDAASKLRWAVREAWKRDATNAFPRDRGRGRRVLGF